MQGLPLARDFFFTHGLPMIRESFKDIADRIAVGLVGPGSECYGFDDQLSRDHDWGPGFCLWLRQKDFQVAIIETLCGMVIDELQRQGLSDIFCSDSAALRARFRDGCIPWVVTSEPFVRS